MDSYRDANELVWQITMEVSDELSGWLRDVLLLRIPEGLLTPSSNLTGTVAHITANVSNTLTLLGQLQPIVEQTVNHLLVEATELRKEEVHMLLTEERRRQTYERQRQARPDLDTVIRLGWDIYVYDVAGYCIVYSDRIDRVKEVILVRYSLYSSHSA